MNRTEATQKIKRDGRVNSAKSILLAVRNDLGDRGLARDAERLASMIARLEEWQTS